ncbi:protein-disulfide reductase DsbD (plasmid) [Burkholderia pyrrocinia]|uniref:protein-disulfide reductase DsbD n=1 Tax=Burkholderia pyrrocinia TaxID=60550 RepID=UPI0038B5B8D1
MEATVDISRFMASRKLGWRVRVFALRVALGVFFSLTSFAAQALDQTDLLPPESAFPLTVSLGGPQQIDLAFDTRPGYYLYRDRFSFMVDGTAVKPDTLPPGELKNDPAFGMVTVYHRPLQLRITLPRVIAAGGVMLSITSQGCADAGVCYPPLTRNFRIAADGTITRAATADGSAAAALQTNGSDSHPAFSVFGISLHPANGITLLEMAGFLLGGLLMAATVCMYPLIPIVAAVIGGGAAPASLWRGFGLSFVYVQGLALTYAVAGTIAALAGMPLVALTQRAWVLAAFGALMVVFALGMFGVFRLQVPGSWQTRFAGWSRRLPGGRTAPVFAMGMLSALIVGPCSTPVLAAALLYIANSRDMIGGALALYTMAIGMGLPLLVFGTFGAHALPKAGRWMVAVQNTLGFMLLAAALWFVYSLLPDWLLMTLLAILFASAGMMLRAIDPLPPDVRGIQRVGKALGVLLLTVGVAELVGVVSGHFDPLRPLGGIAQVSDPASGAAQATARFESIRSNAELDRALADARGRPVMIDFYAEWCITCKELERFTFSDPRVVDEFTHWNLLRIDVTGNTAEDAAMLRRFGLFGPPALIFYGKDGRLAPDAQLAGFVGADAFLAHLRKWNR